MSRKSANKAEKNHMDSVKRLPCIICREGWYDSLINIGIIIKELGNIVSEYDHIIDGYRLGHMFGIPLCKNHHEGKKGYGPKEYHWDSSKINQWKLLEKVYKVLGKAIPAYTPKGRNNFKESNEAR